MTDTLTRDETTRLSAIAQDIADDEEFGFAPVRLSQLAEAKGYEVERERDVEAIADERLYAGSWDPIDVDVITYTYSAWPSSGETPDAPVTHFETIGDLASFLEALPDAPDQE